MRTIRTKLVGVSFGNRQQNIRLCQPGFQLFWKHETDNKYDENSIIVYADPTMQVELGHLNRRLASEFVLRVKEGTKQEIICEQITGGKGDKPTFGMNVRVVIRP